MLDLIVLAGSPGSGKSTVAGLLNAALAAPYIEFSSLREFHLDREWKTQSLEEEQMAFENLVYILKNYFRRGYKNVIVTDLKDFRVCQIPELFADYKYAIITLFVSDVNQLAERLGKRTCGFRDIERAIEWNKNVQERPLLNSEIRLDTALHQPEQIVSRIINSVI